MFSAFAPSFPRLEPEGKIRALWIHLIYKEANHEKKACF
jgi:hypothetical protein